MSGEGPSSYEAMAEILLQRPQMQACVTHVPCLDGLMGGFRAGSVVELRGAAGSGRTELLLQCVASCVLPAHWPVQGSKEVLHLNDADGGMQAILLDCTGQFQLLRLIRIVEAHVRAAWVRLAASVTGTLPEDFETLLKTVLAKVRIIRCHDFADVLAALHLFSELLDAPERRALLGVLGWNALVSGDAEGRKQQSVFFGRLSKIVSEYCVAVLCTRVQSFKLEASWMEKKEDALWSELLQERLILEKEQTETRVRNQRHGEKVYYFHISGCVTCWREEGGGGERGEKEERGEKKAEKMEEEKAEEEGEEEKVEEIGEVAETVETVSL